MYRWNWEMWKAIINIFIIKKKENIHLCLQKILSQLSTIRWRLSTLILSITFKIDVVWLLNHCASLGNGRTQRLIPAINTYYSRILVQCKNMRNIFMSLSKF
jgi:hypothetical protein